DHFEIPEFAPNVVKQGWPAKFELGVDSRRARLMNHDWNAKLNGLGIKRKSQLPVIRRPVLIHRVQLQAREAQLGDRAIEFGDSGPRASEGRIYRGEADDVLWVGPNHGGDVVVAPLRIWRSRDTQLATRVHGADQLAVEVLRRDR